MAIGEPSGECYEKIKLHSNHLLDCYDVIIRINCINKCYFLGISFASSV